MKISKLELELVCQDVEDEGEEKARDYKEIRVKSRNKNEEFGRKHNVFTS